MIQREKKLVIFKSICFFFLRLLLPAVLAKQNESFAKELGAESNKLFQVVVDPVRNKSALDHFGNMALLEWWILAHSHFLISNGFSYYPLTAASIG
jgi:hypothetical protein